MRIDICCWWTWLNVRATDNENRYVLLVDLAKCESHRQ